MGEEREYKLGMDCKAYINVSDSYDDPDWQEITNITDLTLNLEQGEANMTTRGNRGWRATVGTLNDASVEFQMVWDGGADFKRFRRAQLRRRLLDVMVLDGDMDDPDAEGIRAFWAVLKFTRNEALEEGVMADVSMKPGYVKNPAHSPQPIGDDDEDEGSGS